ncbi:hypothetical protein PQR25_30390 [Paraburkholderia nemoris]|uniref:hypothetical protein n=1 Tax=Paraburkholderia nemoris TaxID=2793076 RepID=UPI0038B92C5E
MRDLTSQKLHPYSLNEMMTLTVQHLYSAYVLAVKDVPGETFIEKVLKPLPRLDSRETDQPLEILLQYATDEEKAKGNDAIARSPAGPILLSATYYFRAMHARDNHQPDVAWSYLADARYWCGVSIAQKGLANAYQSVRRDLSKAGGKGKADRYEPTKRYAYELVESEMPQGGWQSRSQAVRKIKDKVLAHAKSLGNAMSEQQAPKTIDKWLSAMPDAMQLFAKK